MIMVFVKNILKTFLGCRIMFLWKIWLLSFIEVSAAAQNGETLVSVQKNCRKVTLQ